MCHFLGMQHSVRSCFFVASIWTLAACGGSRELGPIAPDDASPGIADVATADGSPDIATPEDSPDTATDDSCSDSGKPVWNATSLTFTLSHAGGFTAPPNRDAGCESVFYTYDFSLPDATLAREICNDVGRSNFLVHLSPADVSSVVAAVGAIRTTCEKGCGFDAPVSKLIVRASGAETTYTGNFYAGCPGTMVMPPLVSWESLIPLGSVLEGLITRACASDAGTPDAGTCASR
jgi:hypothetical protein